MKSCCFGGNRCFQHCFLMFFGLAWFLWVWDGLSWDCLWLWFWMFLTELHTKFLIVLACLDVSWRCFVAGAKKSSMMYVCFRVNLVCPHDLFSFHPNLGCFLHTKPSSGPLRQPPAGPTRGSPTTRSLPWKRRWSRSVLGWVQMNSWSWMVFGCFFGESF